MLRVAGPGEEGSFLEPGTIPVYIFQSFINFAIEAVSFPLRLKVSVSN